MKIRVIDRIVLFLLALVVLLMGVSAALNEFGINVLTYVVPLIPADIMTLMSAKLIFALRIAAIVITILLSFYLFSVSCRRKKKPDPFINMESGAKGSIRMSMESISGLVLRTAGQIPGVSGLKVATINHEDSVSIDLSFQVEMSRNIPELSAQIQQLVGEVIERNCGVAVRKVCVTVSGFTALAPQATALPQAEKPVKEKKEKKGLFGREKKAAEPVPAPVVVPVEPELPVEEPAEEEIPAAEEIPTAEDTVIVEAESEVEETEAVPAAEPVQEAAPVEEEQIAEPDEGDEYVLVENE